MSIMCNYAVALLLFLFSLYAVMNPHYNDGLIGKLCYSGLALSCYSVMSSFPVEPELHNKRIMVAFFIAVVVRELFVRMFIPDIEKRQSTNE